MSQMNRNKGGVIRFGADKLVDSAVWNMLKFVDALATAKPALPPPNLPAHPLAELLCPHLIAISMLVIGYDRVRQTAWAG